MKGPNVGRPAGQGPAVTLGLWATGPIVGVFQNSRGEQVGRVRWALELCSFHQLCHVIARADTEEEAWKAEFPIVMATVEWMPSPSVLMVGGDPIADLGARMRDAFFMKIHQTVSRLIERDEAVRAATIERDQAVAQAMRELATNPTEPAPSGEPMGESVFSEGAQRSGN